MQEKWKKLAGAKLLAHDSSLYEAKRSVLSIEARLDEVSSYATKISVEYGQKLGALQIRLDLDLVDRQALAARIEKLEALITHPIQAMSYKDALKDGPDKDGPENSAFDFKGAFKNAVFFEKGPEPDEDGFVRGFVPEEDGFYFVRFDDDRQVFQFQSGFWYAPGVEESWCEEVDPFAVHPERIRLPGERAKSKKLIDILDEDEEEDAP
jgi:hypothetical protein